MLVALLSRDAILAADDLTWEDVEVPEWPDSDGKPGTVRVKALTGAERDAYESSMRQQRGREFVPNLVNVRARLVVRCVTGEDGRPLFSDRDVVALGAKSGAALDRIFEVAARLSRMSEEDMEELAKNSEAAQSGDSTFS